MSALINYVDYFLSPQMRNNPSDLMRGYIFVGLSTFNMLVSLLILVIIYYYLELGGNTPFAVALDLGALGGNLLALSLFKRTQNLNLCSTIVLCITAMIIMAGVQITGGYFDSPILQMMLQWPVIAFLLQGLRLGTYWLIATFMLALAAYVSGLLGWGSVQLMESTEDIEAMYFSLQLVLLLLVGGALVIYETLNGLLNRQLNEERNRFEHKASHDDLTGVPNRFEFFRRLKLVIDEAKEREHKVGVVYIDLDEFKPINDKYGHHHGDQALRTLTRRIQGQLRLSDTTARLGGDEFGLILPGINVPTDVESIMPKVLAAIREPIEIEGNSVSVFGSCGVAIFPDHSVEYNTLCRYADTAMYKAKEQSDSYLVFDYPMLQK